MNICLLGDMEDLAAAYVGWLARVRGHRVLQLPEGTLGAEWSYEIDDCGEGTLRVGDARLSWREIDGVFVRLNPQPPTPEGLTLDPARHIAFLHERRHGLHQLLEAIRAPVINRPSAGRSNASKPAQMVELANAGFDVPKWIVTSSPMRAREFVAHCEHGAIYKACSGLRSRVRKVDTSLWGRLANGTTPTLIQEYVPGTDVRIHTVADRAFACEVAGAHGVDYRFEHDGAQYAPTSVPPTLAAACCEFARNAGLTLAGFDFRVTPDRRWWCLEMNPVPSFLSYEFTAGLPIGEAVLDAMEHGYAPRGLDTARLPPAAVERHDVGRATTSTTVTGCPSP